MTTEPKLLTEQEVKHMFLRVKVEGILADLRERGLIAEEPVDPLLVEARDIALAHANWNKKQWREPCLRGDLDANPFVVAVLAALRRGLELAPRKTLTRDMVRDAMSTPHSAPTETHLDYVFKKLTEALQ